MSASAPEEADLLEADEADASARERADEESLRDAWFALLKGEAEAESEAD